MHRRVLAYTERGYRNNSLIVGVFIICLRSHAGQMTTKWATWILLRNIN